MHVATTTCMTNYIEKYTLNYCTLSKMYVTTIHSDIGISIPYSKFSYATGIRCFINFNFFRCKLHPEIPTRKRLSLSWVIYMMHALNLFTSINSVFRSCFCTPSFCIHWVNVLFAKNLIG